MTIILQFLNSHGEVLNCGFHIPAEYITRFRSDPAMFTEWWLDYNRMTMKGVTIIPESITAIPDSGISYWA